MNLKRPDAAIPQLTPARAAAEASQPVGLSVRNLSLQLDGRAILNNISLQLPQTGITALIGPSGAGKSSLLRCINRLHEHWQGDIDMAGASVRATGADALRRQIGLIGQKPAVFPCSIRENVIFGLPRRHRNTASDEGIRTALTRAALWREVADRLDDQAVHLSMGQQQRLCLARALILDPAILLLDEPTSALDPRSRDVIEQAMRQLAGAMPLLWVTHDLEQARRISERIIFICDGKLIEQADAADFFTRPERIESREFLRWSVCDCD
jgi:phosphate transport system ATP-binding protein